MNFILIALDLGVVINYHAYSGSVLMLCPFNECYEAKLCEIRMDSLLYLFQSP